MSPVTSPAAADEADELHRRALERRRARTGTGSPAAASPATTAASTAASPSVAGARISVPADASGSAPISLTLPVLGMTCRSCEVRIAKHVRRIPGVARVNASAVRGEVVVECTEPVAPAAIERAIADAGYELGRTPWVTRDPRAWATAGIGVGLVAAVALAVNVTGLGDLAGNVGELSSGGLVVALLLGLAAGVSTCMAMVGGLVLGLAASFSARRQRLGEPTGAAAQLRPAAVFVAGRVTGYALFGALLGAVGASLSMPPLLTAVLMIGVGILMTILGTRLTGLSPRIAGWSPTLPLGLGARLGLTGSDADGDAGYSHARAAGLGALSFFLPCGFTQAVQVYALSTGSPVFAAALLGVFALGTAPGLLALAGLPALVPATARPTLLRLVGVVVLGFALVNVTAGLRLSGISLPSLTAIVNAAPLPGTLGADGVQAITTHQDAGGYSPANVVIYAGYPTRWTVESSTTATCAASIWAPDVNIRARLHEGANTFDLPAMQAGTLRYTCSMGMYDGMITVVDPPADLPATGSAPTTTTTDEPSTTAAASTAPAAPVAQATARPAVQELRTWQDARGYGPAVATITAGVPTRWTIESRSSASCAAFMVVPDLGISRTLARGDGNVIDLPALPAGRIDYTCSMGMYWASIDVVAGS